ncbi:uncharacterized protein YfdQ (DUF2303 family) [Duganella sp. 1224]|uniref:DUF2303 family protein n=1 Tax=Duganella sp. 1224 TaxID=2587052 RepID=UPI0015CB3AD1|nr:DUF2303 family protein [Duganella sp. 1224]NYE62218.1 uncharacterized protein YfdQ (DUF2303 family) [Duganella sp. 1224]
MNEQTATAELASTAAAPLVGEHLHITDTALDKLARMANAAKATVEVGGITQLLVPADYKVVDLTAVIEAARPAPTRKSGTVRLTDLDSFLTYVTQQGNPAITRIFADMDARTLTAIFNDHGNVDAGDATGWRDHRAVYTAELSKEFATWLKYDGEKMGQEPFAVFIEDNIADITQPTGETLLLVASTLQAKNEVNFSSSHRLDNGQVQLCYTENLNASAGVNGSLEIPRTFEIGARVFKGGAGYKVRARLKYRLVGGGKVSFWYELDRPDVSLEHAFKEYVDQVRNSQFTVLHGKA